MGGLEVFFGPVRPRIGWANDPPRVLRWKKLLSRLTPISVHTGRARNTAVFFRLRRLCRVFSVDFPIGSDCVSVDTGWCTYCVSAHAGFMLLYFSGHADNLRFSACHVATSLFSNNSNSQLQWYTLTNESFPQCSNGGFDIQHSLCSTFHGNDNMNQRWPEPSN